MGCKIVVWTGDREPEFGLEQAREVLLHIALGRTDAEIVAAVRATYPSDESIARFVRELREP